MTRRDWLKAATTAAVGLTVDPERLLWTPGRRVYVDQAGPRYGYQVGEIVFGPPSLWDGYRPILGVWDGTKIVTYGPAMAVFRVGTLRG